MKLRNVIDKLSSACVELVFTTCLRCMLMANRVNTLKTLFKQGDKHA
jgi:hypothetical protein